MDNPLFPAGKHCELEINPCDSLPCLHGGTCLPSDAGSFKCLCHQGHSNFLCSVFPYSLHIISSNLSVYIFKLVCLCLSLTLLWAILSH